MALLASAVGNTIVKSPAVDVLSAPKSSTTTEGSPDAVSLKINAPRAVIVAVLKVRSSKSVKAVVPLDVGSTRVSALPFAVYPVQDTSFVAVYAVVAAVNEALLSYKARLKVLPPEFLKL